jgi:hypothetical protein
MYFAPCSLPSTHQMAAGQVFSPTSRGDATHENSLNVATLDY